MSLVLISWIFSFILSFPQFAATRYNHKSKYCYVSWTSKTALINETEKNETYSSLDDKNGISANGCSVTNISTPEKLYHMVLVFFIFLLPLTVILLW